MARGLALEGERVAEKRALDYADDQVVTCGPGDRVGPLAGPVAQSPYGFALVTAEDRILLGRLRQAALQGDPDARAEDVMEPGPSTNRPNTSPAELLEKLERADLRTAILTDPDGRLMGVVRRSELPV
jgi:CBS-domain-containing membrane protein